MQDLSQTRQEKRGHSALCVLLIVLMAFLFSLTARSQIFITYSDYIDSSVFQYIARIIQIGGIPYRDTFDHKGPFLYCLNTLALWISPGHGLWCIEFLCLLAFFLLCYFLVRLFCRKTTAVFAVLVIIPFLYKYFDGGNLTEEYALPFITGALYIFSDYFLNQKITRFRLFLCGASLGAVLLLRVNMIAIWIVMSIGVLIQCIFCRNYKQIFYFLGYFVLGLCIFIAPFVIWLTFHGGLRDFWKDYILFNFLYSSDSQRAGIHAKIRSFSNFFYTKWVISAVAVIGASWLKKRDWLNILYLFCLFLTLLLICISGQAYGHYGMTIAPIMIIPIAYVVKVCDDEWSQSHLCSVFIILCLLISTVLPVWQTIVDNAVLSYQYRGTTQIDHDTVVISSWLEENTTPEEQIIVCGNWNEIYNQSNRFAASQYSYQSPVCSINSDMEKEFFDEITRNKPAAIVLPDDFYAYDQMLLFINTHNYTEVIIDEVDDSISLYHLS